LAWFLPAFLATSNPSGWRVTTWFFPIWGPIIHWWLSQKGNMAEIRRTGWCSHQKYQYDISTLSSTVITFNMPIAGEALWISYSLSYIHCKLVNNNLFASMSSLWICLLLVYPQLDWLRILARSICLAKKQSGRFRAAVSS
jgi:hypothetical protein